jgi:hypothetical protein
MDVQYLALASLDRPTVTSQESLELRWWSVHALPERTDDSVRALVRRALAVQG